MGLVFLSAGLFYAQFFVFSSFAGSFFLSVSLIFPLFAEEKSLPVPPPTANFSSVSDADLLSKLEKFLSSGALDRVLEQRWDIIQERKRALRLAQQREKKRQAEASRKIAIQENMPPPDTDQEPFLGRKDATFSLIEYSDFGCPCKAPEFLDTVFHKNHAASAMGEWAARTCEGVA